MDGSPSLPESTSNASDDLTSPLDLLQSRLVLDSFEGQNRGEECSSPAYSCAPSLNPAVTNVTDFVRLLQRSSLPGPMVFTSNREQIGRGAQFLVFKQWMAIPDTEIGFTAAEVAVKQPQYLFSPDQALNLADPTVKRQVHDMYLEILALCHPTLRSHRNIVRLMGWGEETSTWHSPLVLAFELALSDLHVFLVKAEMDQEDSDSIRSLWDLKYRLCLDTAAGLDALHECQIVHGDLKPANVLIFRDEAGIVAKLADFGLSVEEQKTAAPCLLGGTKGWQAPEVEQGNVSNEFLLQADSYSYGLLVWSVMFLGGTTPPGLDQGRVALASAAIKNNASSLPHFLQALLKQALPDLLRDNGQGRPIHLLTIMKTESHLYDDWIREYKSVANGEETPSNSGSDSDAEFEWELRPVLEHLINEFLERFDQDPRSLPGDYCFALALRLYSYRVPYAKALDLFCAAALLDYEPAQAIIPRVYSYAKKSPPPEVKSRIVDWLQNAASTGSIVALQDLAKLDPTAARNTFAMFRSLGGYNRFYCKRYSKNEIEVLSTLALTKEMTVEKHGYNWLHWAAAYSSLSDIIKSAHLIDQRIINEKSAKGETCVYLACVRGSWGIAEFLLKYGADPSIPCTSRGLTCLHWLFTFEPELQNAIAQRLIQEGADANAMTMERLPLYHYPFFLPIGSPLHWAVSVSSPTAMKALITNGADPHVRNGCDPYRYDDRVRTLDKFGWPDLQAFSVAKQATLGLSPLDIAAQNHDPFLFQTLEVATSVNVNVNASDEEGFTVLHRLSRPYSNQLHLENQYNYRFFKGRLVDQIQDLRATVKSIISLGGHVNQFTKQIVERSSPREKSSNTPLMLAMLSADIDLIKALLESHADVSLENEEGETALHCVGLWENEGIFVEACELLVAHGANVNHKSSSGKTPIFCAAFGNHTDVIDFFLTQGVDLAQRYSGPDPPYESRTIWATLTHGEPPYEADDKVASLIEKHLLRESDMAKRNLIIEQANGLGQSLYHHYAWLGMAHSIIAILKSGCNVNSTIKKWNMRSAGDGIWVKNIWYATPLDEALTRQKRTQKVTRLSPVEKAQLWREDERVILALRKAGAVEAPVSMRSQKKIPFSKEDFESNAAWLEALTEL